MRHWGLLDCEKWGTKMRFKLCLAALAASVATATPAFAQSATATADARGTVLQSLTLVRQTHLDFGTVAPDAVNPGTVSINADTGARTTGGSVIALPGVFSRAQFDGSGTPGNTVQLTLTQPAGGVISSGANNLGAVLSLDSSPNPRTIPVGGVFSAYVGGTFSVAANQPSGLYVGQFDLTAIYQ